MQVSQEIIIQFFLLKSRRTFPAGTDGHSMISFMCCRANKKEGRLVHIYE